MGDNRWLRNSFVYLIILIAALALFFQFFRSASAGSDEKSITAVLADVQAGRITQIEAQDDDEQVIATYNDGTRFRSRLESGDSILSLLAQYGVPLINADGTQLVNVKVQPKGAWGGMLSILTILLPTLLLIGFFVFFMRQAQGSNNQALSFGKSGARMFTGDKPTVTFVDIAGQERAKQDLTEIVEFLKFPDKFAVLGARIPRGVLMVGPPGTGKTLLSRAIAGEAGVPFFSISGSEFVEMFVGVGASRVRDLFAQAKRNAPCIVFIDEIDAVGRQRGSGIGGSHDEREQTLNQILVEMDGFNPNTNVIVVAATNRPDLLDPALIRPGRFDRYIALQMPDLRGREGVLKTHLTGKPMSDDVDLKSIAKITVGFSGADIAEVVNEAAILAARRSKKKIGIAELQDSVENVVYGVKQGKRLSERDREMIAYRQAARSIVAYRLPNAERSAELSLSIALGTMGRDPALERPSERLRTRSQFEDTMAVLLSGRVAEKQIFDDISIESEHDLASATVLAWRMVSRYGMSDELVPRFFQTEKGNVTDTNPFNYSEATARMLDSEVDRFIERALQTAERILREEHERLVIIGQRLLQVELIRGEDLHRLLVLSPADIEAALQT